MYRIKLRNHFQASWLIFFWIGLMTILYGFILDFNLAGMTAFIFLILLFLIPTLIMHIQYWIKNYGMAIDITSDGIILETGGFRKTYKTEEIKEIIFRKSANLDPPVSMYFFPTDNYCYAQFNFKNGESLIITSLLDPKIENDLKKFNDVKITRKKGPCFIE
jgi:hypothetical protein